LTVFVSTALFAVSYRAYSKKHNKKFMYVCTAFGVFMVKEVVIGVNALYFDLSIITAGIHMLNLAILALFFKGTVQ